MMYCEICFSLTDPEWICDTCERHYCEDCSYSFTIHYQFQGNRCYQCADQSRRTPLNNRDIRINQIFMKTLKDKIKDIKKRRSGLRLSSKTIQTGTRSIRAVWTRDMTYEIESYHGLDTTQELEQMLLRELNSQGPTN